MHLVIIADVNGPESYHVGEEAMLGANLSVLRQKIPEVVFTIISRDPAWTSAYWHARAVFPIGFPPARSAPDSVRERLFLEVLQNAARWKQSGELNADAAGKEVIQQIAQADGLIISGGGNICSTWPEHLYERAVLIRIAHGFGKPVILGGQTLGPELTQTERELLKSTLPLATVLGVRDHSSVGVALSLEVDPYRLVYQVDDALFLDVKPVPAERFGVDLRRGRQPWIAVTIAPFLDVQLDQSPLGIIANQLTQIAEATQARLVFVPHVAAPPDRYLESDVVFAQHLAKHFGVSTSPLLLGVCMAEEVNWLTAQASLVISSRYHPIVFGLASGVPAFGIYQDDYTRVKIRGALAHAELQDCSMPLDSCLAGKLAGKVLELWRKREFIERGLMARRERWRNREEARWRRIIRELKGAPSELASGEARITSPRVGTEELTISSVQKQERELEWIRSAVTFQQEELVLIQEDLRERNRELGSITTVAAARGRELDFVKEVLAERDRELASIRPVLAAREQELASVKAVLAAREQELVSVKEVLADRDRELASIKPVLAAREEELASVKDILAERDRELASVKPVLAAREEELASVKEVLAERDRELASIKPVLAAREQELAAVKDTIKASAIVQ